MITIKAITIEQPGLSGLIALSDAYMQALYPDESNHLEDLSQLARPNVLLVGAFEKNVLGGIGAVKIETADKGSKYGEIKRVFVVQEFRGKGVSGQLMAALENHLVEETIFLSRLETGIYQPEAIGLYRKLGYQKRLPFGCYRQDPLSIFMEKKLDKVESSEK